MFPDLIFGANLQVSKIKVQKHLGKNRTSEILKVCLEKNRSLTTYPSFSQVTNNKIFFSGLTSYEIVFDRMTT